jgi:DNA-binding LacI/PurR family transcriptional regulator
MASNNLAAMGAIGAIAEAGLRVPEDISVVGFDDIHLSAFTIPPLTTVRLPRAEIANAAFRALLNAQHTNVKKMRSEEHLIRPTFVRRKSTGPASR